MAIPMVGSTGALFNRLGKVGAAIATTSTNMNSLFTNLANSSTGIVSQYQSETDLQAIIGGTYIATLSNLAVVTASCQQLTQQTFNRMVFRDNPQLNQTLSQVNINSSIPEVIRQMKMQGTTILAMTITLTPQTFASTGNQFANPQTTATPGNGVMVFSNKRPFDGLVLENTYGETFTLTCTADSYSGGTAAGNEGFSLTGQGAETSLFAFDWPLGSNCSARLSAINGAANATQGNVLFNSGWETWAGTPLLPVNWVVVTGSALISKSTGIVFTYTGSAALLITGDGSTKVNLKQQFGSSTGTTVSLKTSTQYAHNIWLRTGGAGATGILTIQLVDGNGNVINDNNNVPNTSTINLSALNTTWTAFNTIFRTPRILPSTVFLQYITSTAVNNGGQVYMDQNGMGIMTQTYTSGPYAALFSGNVNFLKGDYGFATVTNSRGAGGTLTTFQTLLARLLDPLVYNGEILFPSSNTPTVSDSLIA